MGDDETEDADAKAIGRALMRLRERAGLTQQEAANRFGIDTAAGWGKYERGLAPSVHAPNTQQKLVRALGVTVEDLLRARAQVEAGLDDRERPPTPATHTGVIDLAANSGLTPVYGLAAAQGDVIVIATGRELRWAPMHPAQRGYARHGAVEVVGESMFPRYKPRELAYFVFDLGPRRGGVDDVIIELTDGTAMIKEYVDKSPTALTLREYFPKERTFELGLDKVKAVHTVVR